MTLSNRWFAASLLVLPVLLAACGGSDSPPPADTTPPTVLITDDVVAANATGDVTFIFNFSEDVGSSFTAGDVTVTGGTKAAAVTRLTSTEYRLVVTPPADALGTLSVSFPAGSFADLAGNNNASAATATQDFDTQLAQMDLPVNFDLATVNYGLLGFGGAEDSTIVADPAGGTNKVARVVKVAAAETWAGTTLTADGTLGFASKVPFDASNTRMTVRVYSPDAGIQVRLKVEDHTNATVSVETEATTTLANTWETLTFDFASAAPGTAALNLASTYDKASIFFNFGVSGATAGSKTYHFDDVTFIGGGGTGGGTVAFSTVTFDSATVTYALTGFGGAEDSQVVVDPVVGTNHVARVNRAAGSETYAGTTFSTGANQSVGKVPFDASNTRMTVRVYSPDAGIPVRLKVEDHANPTVSVETEAITTLANTWETLTFDFASAAPGTAALNLASTYDKASIFFDFGRSKATAVAKTYYFDDVTFIGGGGTGGGTGAFSTLTFDDALLTYTFTDFEGAIGGAKVADPAGGANMVGQTVKPVGAQPWAGTTVSTGANQSVGKIPLTATKTSMTVRVYTPAVGIRVHLKIEDAADVTKTCETDAVTTVANGWETVTFNFANVSAGTNPYNPATNFNKVSIFFDFLVTPTVENTFYFDDIAFVP